MSRNARSLNEYVHGLLTQQHPLCLISGVPLSFGEDLVRLSPCPSVSFWRGLLIVFSFCEASQHWVLKFVSEPRKKLLGAWQVAHDQCSEVRDDGIVGNRKEVEIVVFGRSSVSHDEPRLSVAQ